MVAMVGASLLWWGLRPSWTVLYSGLTPDEARQIGVVLSTANLTYDVSRDGTILRVPSKDLDKSRLTTASKASGKNGRLGYELFDKPDWAGSDFDEKVNYQRALEGELEKTIDSISDVQSCSVHLVLPHDSLFTSSQRNAKASVVVRLRSQKLSREEADSIKSLVAHAVDDLTADDVVLMDADGHSLGGRKSVSDSKDEYERALADHILQALEPITGVGNVHAVVNVDYDLSSHDTIDEDFDPSSVVTLSMQRSEQTSGAPVAALGVPGTASNTPNVQAPLYPAQKPEAQSSKQESGTYAASKKTEHSLENSGSVKRISAAVIVNDHMIIGQDPKQPAVAKPWTSDQLRQIATISQAAVGFNLLRGDSVVVQNLHFEAVSQEKDGIFANLMKQVRWVEPAIKDLSIALIALMALLFVVRPAVLLLNTHHQQARILEVGVKESRTGLQDNAIASNVARGVLDKVVTQIQAEPSQSARVLQNWIGAD